MNLEEQLKVVKKSLVHFVSAHIPGADFSVIDDIVLSYITSVMEDASQDPCFDVDSFIEMLTPYFSDFSSINSTLICEWIFQLENELLAMQNEGSITPLNISFRFVFFSFIKVVYYLYSTVLSNYLILFRNQNCVPVRVVWQKTMSYCLYIIKIPHIRRNQVIVHPLRFPAATFIVKRLQLCMKFFQTHHMQR